MTSTCTTTSDITPQLLHCPRCGYAGRAGLAWRAGRISVGCKCCGAHLGSEREILTERLGRVLCAERQRGSR